MSWFQDNKFLAIFGGSVVAVGGFLGYMVMGASSKYDDAQTHFDETSKKLSGLYASTPYPIPDNVEALKKRKDEVAREIASLQEKLAAIKIKTDKPENVPVNSFQDKLKESMGKLTTKAGEMDMTLPKEFYLGFESYKDKPPQTSYAAAALLKELRALELVMDLLMQNKQVEIKSWSRVELDEELKGYDPAKKKKKLIRKDAFSVKFVTTQSHFMGVMNGISGHKEQIFVIRNIHVANTAPDSPPKVSLQAGNPGGAAPFAPPATPPATPPAAAGNPPGAPAAAAQSGLETVFGQERVEATLDIDIVDVADPDTTVAVKGNSKSK